jgi:hypothetical protein
MKLYTSNIYAKNHGAMHHDFLAGLTAAMSAALGFLTMPFKGVQANSLKVGK